MYYSTTRVSNHQLHQQLKQNGIPRDSLLYLSELYLLVNKIRDNNEFYGSFYHDLAGKRKVGLHYLRRARYGQFKRIVAEAWVRRWNAQKNKFDKTSVSKNVKARLSDIDKIVAVLVSRQEDIFLYNGKVCVVGSANKQYPETLSYAVSQDRFRISLFVNSIYDYYPLFLAVLEDRLVRELTMLKHISGQADLEARGLAYQLAGTNIYDLHE